MTKFLRIVLVICICVSCLVVGCSPLTEPIKIYYEDIEVEIIDISKNKYYKDYMHYEITCTVYSEEYDITATITENGSGLWIPDSWNYEKDDIVTVRMYSKVIESTGEVIERKISGFYSER